MVGIGIAAIGVVLARQPKLLSANAADPTFAEDVAPIFYKNCTTCHRPNGLAPFSLVDYDSAKANINEMYDAVSSKKMPPWHAEGARDRFTNDRRLSDADRQTILRWIDAGAKSGDLKKLPPKPDYPTRWVMGNPDLVAGMTEGFTVPAQGTVEYQYFQVPLNLTEDKWVTAIEILPGAREVVHHVLVYAKPPAPAPAAAPPPAPRPAGSPPPQPLFLRVREQATLPPDPPRTDAHAPRGNPGVLLATETPGNNMMQLPKGTAWRLRAGTVLTFQMHYTAHGHEMTDQTQIAFRFAKEPPEEEIFASHFFNGALVLPAGAKDVQVPAEIGVSEPVKIWGMMPHTHLRGTRWQYTLEKPDGSSEIVLDVPRYDFNWQTYYMFNTPLVIPPGAKLRSMAWYDNSASNKNNPDATKDVKWGDQTWEEMQYTGILYSVPSRKLAKPGHN